MEQSTSSDPPEATAPTVGSPPEVDPSPVNGELGSEEPIAATSATEPSALSEERPSDPPADDVDDGEGMAPGEAPESAEPAASTEPPDWATPPTPGEPPGAAADAAQQVESPAATRTRHHGGPNWMLAFVGVWSGLTSLGEALFRMSQVKSFLTDQAFLGYGLLGVGLLVFGGEALLWGRRRGGGPLTMAILLPAALTLAGLVLLILSHDPGRRI